MKYWRRLFSTGYIDPSDNWPNVTSTQSSMIVSLLSAGTFFGALGAGPTADSIGRRLAMIIESVVFIFGVILQTAATSIPLFVAGRFFAGLGVGLLSATGMAACALFVLALEANQAFDSSSLPIRDCSQMDPRYNRRRISARCHHRSALGSCRQQLYEEPHGHRLLPHSNRNSVCLGYYPYRGYADTSRDATLPG